LVWDYLIADKLTDWLIFAMMSSSRPSPFPVLGLLRYVAGITEQNNYIISEIIWNASFFFVDIATCLLGNATVNSGFQIWQLDLLDFTSCNYNYSLHNFTSHKPETCLLSPVSLQTS
jgi:hypothetical protein